MLPSAPWNLDALIRLCASILLAILCVGGLGRPTLGFVGNWQHPNLLPFLAWGLPALFAFGAAIWMLRRPIVREAGVRPMILLMGSIYAGFLFVWLASGYMPDLAEGDGVSARAGMVISVIGFQGLTLLLVWRSLREMGSGWNAGFGLNNRPVHSISVGAIVACLFIPIGLLLVAGAGELMQRAGREPVEQQAVQVMRTAQATDIRLLLGISAVLIAPIAEEVLFRGILYPFIKQRGYPRLALWGTSLLFAVIHANMMTLAALVVLALLLVALYEKTGNLLAPISAHMVFNGVNYLALLYGIG